MSSFCRLKPCVDCPFRKKGGIRLTRGRAQEIASMMLSKDGKSFPCHEEVHTLIRKHPKHCAGALIFMEKHKTITQMARIAERLGLYDHKKLKDKEAVFDTLSEMLEANDE